MESELISRQEFSKRWHEAHYRRLIADEDSYQKLKSSADQISASAGEALNLLADLKVTSDFEAFRVGMSTLVRKLGADSLQSDGTFLENIGLRLLDKIDAHGPQELAEVLAKSLSLPLSDEEASVKIGTLDYYLKQTTRIRNYHSHIPGLLSYFWALADRNQWPIMWVAQRQYIRLLTGENIHGPGGRRDLAKRYQVYIDCVREVSTDYLEFEITAEWWRNTNPVIWDEVLVDYISLIDYTKSSQDSRYPSRVSNVEQKSHTNFLISISRYWATNFERKISTILDHQIERLDSSFENYPYMHQVRSLLSTEWILTRWRNINLSLNDSSLSLRVQLHEEGAEVGLMVAESEVGRPTKNTVLLNKKAVAILETANYPNYFIIDKARYTDEKGKRGTCFYGRYIKKDELVNIELLDTIVEVCEELKPLVDELFELRYEVEQRNEEYQVLSVDKTGQQEKVTIGSNSQTDFKAEHDPLNSLADDLLIDRSFLDEIVNLLEDKGQVIFYGPSGTGKTYLAKKLAEVLSPDSNCRELVQLHSASSYESFFGRHSSENERDGYTPNQLVPGPLACMAEQAKNNPDQCHIMVIDEINRVNVSRVFGELLYLLEYRGENISTHYQPMDSFQVPQNLWFIGTMNISDSSVALLDTGFRRRFHFIPFFPNQTPIQGLLDRWLERNGEPSWIGELVTQVNDALEEELGGSHHLIGPSHFMKTDLDEREMRRIWKFNIEPLIEDLFFGDSVQTKRFRFESVYERYREQSEI